MAAITRSTPAIASAATGDPQSARTGAKAFPPPAKPKAVAQSPGWDQEDFHLRNRPPGPVRVVPHGSSGRPPIQPSQNRPSDAQFGDRMLRQLPAWAPIDLSVSDIELALTPTALELQDNGAISNFFNTIMRGARGAVNGVSNTVGDWLKLPPSATAIGRSTPFTVAMRQAGVSVHPHTGAFTLPNDRRGGAILAAAVMAANAPGDPTGTGFGGLQRVASRLDLLAERGASPEFLAGLQIATDRAARGILAQSIRDFVEGIAALGPGLAARRRAQRPGGTRFGAAPPPGDARLPSAGQISGRPYLRGLFGFKLMGRMSPQRMADVTPPPRPVPHSKPNPYTNRGLTAADLHSVNGFQTKAAFSRLSVEDQNRVAFYSGSTYRGINAGFRGGQPTAEGLATLSAFERIAAIIPPGTLLTRGVRDPSGELTAAIRRKGVGTVLADQALVSTTMSDINRTPFGNSELIFRFTVGAPTQDAAVKGAAMAVTRTTSRPGEPHNTRQLGFARGENEMVVLPGRFVVTGIGEPVVDAYGISRTVVDATLLPNAPLE